MTISILGAGVWGLTIAKVLIKNGNKVIVWSHSEEKINNLLTTYCLNNISIEDIKDDIEFNVDLKNTVLKSNVLVLATSSVYVREIANKIKGYINENSIIVLLSKGIEKETLYTMSKVVEDEFKTIKNKNIKIVSLSGPTIAYEVSKNMPTTILSSSKDNDAASKIQDLFMNETFRVYTNTDIECVELCAALKNIYALVCGIANGLGFGDNTKAAIITRGLAEMIRLGTAMGYNEKTFYGLAGIGDLCVTCMSENSRNNTCGKFIGEGYSINEAIEKVGMVVEGINCLPAAYSLKEKYNVDMPICQGMFDVVFNNRTPYEVLNNLMLREKKKE